MKFVIEFDRNHKLCRVTLHGRVDNPGALEAYKHMGHAVNGLKPNAGILDLSAISSFEVTPGAIRHLASLPPILPDPHLRCHVAPDDLLFGMMRMFQMLGEQNRENLHVVRSMTEAYTVLGIQDEPEFQTHETIETSSLESKT